MSEESCLLISTLEKEDDDVTGVVVRGVVEVLTTSSTMSEASAKHNRRL